MESSAGEEGSEKADVDLDKEQKVEPAGRIKRPTNDSGVALSPEQEQAMELESGDVANKNNNTASSVDSGADSPNTLESGIEAQPDHNVDSPSTSSATSSDKEAMRQRRKRSSRERAGDENDGNNGRKDRSFDEAEDDDDDKLVLMVDKKMSRSDSGTSEKNEPATSTSAVDNVDGQDEPPFGRISVKRKQLRQRRRTDSSEDKMDEVMPRPNTDEQTEQTNHEVAHRPDSEDVRDHDSDLDDVTADPDSPTELQQITAESLRSMRPGGNWRVQPALSARELGGFGAACRKKAYAGAVYSNDLFRHDVIGSQFVVERMDCMWKLQRHEGCVNCLNFNASGTRLASGSDDTNVVIWDWLYNEPLLTFDTGHSLNVFQAKFMPFSGDCHLVTCARDGQVRLAELSNTGDCRATRKLAKHSAPAHKLAMDASSPHVFLSCGEDAVIFEVDLREQTPKKLLICRNGTERKVPLYSIQSHPLDTNYFTVGGRDTHCRVYDKRKITEGTAAPVKCFCPHRLEEADFRPHITSVVYNHNGTEILASYNDDDIYIFNALHSDGDEYTHRFTGHRNSATVKGVNFYGPSSEFVISGSDCGHIYFWERQSQAIVHFAPADEQGVVNVLEPHPTCAALATSGLDHDVKIWLPLNDDPEFEDERLAELYKDNMRQRMRERMHPDPDADFIYYMLRQILRRRRRARRAMRAGEPLPESSSSDDENGGDGADDDDDEDDDTSDDDGDQDADQDPARRRQRHHPAQCRTS